MKEKYQSFDDWIEENKKFIIEGPETIKDRNEKEKKRLNQKRFLARNKIIDTINADKVEYKQEKLAIA